MDPLLRLAGKLRVVADDQRFRQRVCERKTAYVNLRAAQKAARIVGRNLRREMQWYRCPACFCYHLCKTKYGEEAA